MMYRHAEPMDWQYIKEALVRLEQHALAYNWTNKVDVPRGHAAIAEFLNSGNAYIVDGYLVMVDVIQPWYSYDNLLQEWLVLKVYPGGSVNSIPPALLAIAKERGCKTVISADSSPLSIVENAYKEAGFMPLTRSYYKEVPNGCIEKLGS